MKEIVIFIDNGNVNINNINFYYISFMEGVNTLKTKNPIKAMTLSSNYFFISRSLGNIYQYDISTLKLSKKFNFKESIKKLGVSPFETYLWTIDTEDMLHIHNIKYKNKDKENKKLNEFTQKEVWELEWVHKVEDFDENFEDNYLLECFF